MQVVVVAVLTMMAEHVLLAQVVLVAEAQEEQVKSMQVLCKILLQQVEQLILVQVAVVHLAMEGLQ